MASRSPETNKVIYECSKCPASKDKTVKLWRQTCAWAVEAELMCRACAETDQNETIAEEHGPKIGKMVPAIIIDDPIDLFKPFSMYNAFLTEESYQQWADLPER